MNEEQLKKDLFSKEQDKVFETLFYFENNPEHIGVVKDEIIKKLEIENNIFIIIKILETVRKSADKEIIFDIFNILKESSDEYIRATLLRVLTVEKRAEYINYIVKCLKDSDHRVRANAVETLESMGLKNTIPEIAYLLKDSSPRVKISAAKALYSFGDKRMLKVFEKLSSGSDVFVNESVIHTLWQINDNKTFELLVNIFRTTKNERLIIKLMEVFSNIGTKEIIPEIRKLTVSFNKKIAENATICLNNILENQTKKKYCEVCKKEFPESQNFCGLCGRELNSISQ
ncbi:MAG: HEAT repeat domain-containing protein [Candidatus Muirbacterium halophilum]|nr:HEAT repeat domain-containing protein [Candidatus Muirbacterium halophilum]MCK9477039.1 HEAT repeat domain-containing protein [Candidatus Muirbacterium halophilum]